MTDLTKLERALESATLLPWWTAHEEPQGFTAIMAPLEGSYEEAWVASANGAPPNPDAHLIVLAVNALPDLIAEIRALRGESNGTQDL